MSGHVSGVSGASEWRDSGGWSGGTDRDGGVRLKGYRHGAERGGSDYDYASGSAWARYDRGRDWTLTLIGCGGWWTCQAQSGS